MSNLSVGSGSSNAAAYQAAQQAAEAEVDLTSSMSEEVVVESAEAKVEHPVGQQVSPQEQLAASLGADPTANLKFAATGRPDQVVGTTGTSVVDTLKANWEKHLAGEVSFYMADAKSAMKTAFGLSRTLDTQEAFNAYKTACGDLKSALDRLLHERGDPNSSYNYEAKAPIKFDGEGGRPPSTYRISYDYTGVQDLQGLYDKLTNALDTLNRDGLPVRNLPACNDVADVFKAAGLFKNQDGTAVFTDANLPSVPADREANHLRGLRDEAMTFFSAVNNNHSWGANLDTKAKDALAWARSYVEELSTHPNAREALGLTSQQLDSIKQELQEAESDRSRALHLYSQSDWIQGGISVGSSFGHVTTAFKTLGWIL